MELAILLVCAVVAAMASGLTLNIKKWKLSGSEASYSMLLPHGWKQIVCAVLMALTMIGYVLFANLYYTYSWYFILKRVLLLTVLWGAAVFDHREMRIPNKLILGGLGLRAIMLIAELFVYNGRWDRFGSMLLWELIAAGAVLLICGLGFALTKGGLGMGDVKLLMAAGLFLGGEGLLYTAFFAVFVSFFASVFLLITRRKTKNDVIPFAPFFLIGSFAALMLSGI